MSFRVVMGSRAGIKSLVACLLGSPPDAPADGTVVLVSKFVWYRLVGYRPSALWLGKDSVIVNNNNYLQDGAVPGQI